MTTKYTNDHEWIRLEGDIATVGITDYAQDQLGDIVFVDLPEVDEEIDLGDEISVIESVKAAGDVKSPLTGTIVEVNDSLDGAPETVNSDPQGDGWIFKAKINDASELDEYMDEEAYKAFVESLA